MYFSIKNTLKNNRNHTPKQTFNNHGLTQTNNKCIGYHIQCRFETTTLSV